MSPDGSTFGEADVKAAFGTVMTNSAGMCIMGRGMGYNIIPGGMASIYEAILGRSMDEETFNTIGKRIMLLRLAFNIREGLTRDKVNMSPRLEGKPPLSEGPDKGVTLDTENYADQFFEALGCDVKTGKPYRETLEEVGGLDEVIRQLYG